MNNYQQTIKKFAEDRNWGQFHNPKDLLLGIVEEIGELRNIVKWEQNPDTLHQVLVDNKNEVEDGIGDIFWFLALLANGCEVDIDNAIERTIKDNEARFPTKEVKDKHTNRYLGGKDKKYDHS
ncbi:MAG: MazG nucleotide pyrophosphohydrolase domain-containing protein [Patescibacteria group bacterium]|jgi:NTP pyrophosphatase (non-canonical NTP hydrolase)